MSKKGKGIPSFMIIGKRRGGGGGELSTAGGKVIRKRRGKKNGLTLYTLPRERKRSFRGAGGRRTGGKKKKGRRYLTLRNKNFNTTWKERGPKIVRTLIYQGKRKEEDVFSSLFTISES